MRGYRAAGWTRADRRAYRRALGTRRRRWPFVVVPVSAIAIALVVTAGPHQRGAVRLDGWQSQDLVAVSGEPAATCAAALPPDWIRLDAQQTIVCGKAGSYRCYRRRLHDVTYGLVRTTRVSWDTGCAAALAVVHRAELIG
jgi:hypothetical protein